MLSKDSLEDQNVSGEAVEVLQMEETGQDGPGPLVPPSTGGPSLL